MINLIFYNEKEDMQKKNAHFDNIYEALETNNLSVLKKAIRNGLDFCQKLRK